ncbi:hypothetical protein [Nocardiopsis synnemataformans]|uniref:hypothetical protein n=1 Tax=Nocardiopsis synnemataformans TaxID=61305 RepID=UPI003EBFD249
MADPVTLAIAAAVVTGAVGKITEAATGGTVAAFKSLRKAVFARFRSDPESQQALDDALLEPEDPEALAAVAEHLERAEGADPGIRGLMQELRREVVQEGDGAVHNSIQGDVSGKARVFQGRDFHGDIHL